MLIYVISLTLQVFFYPVRTTDYYKSAIYYIILYQNMLIQISCNKDLEKTSALGKNDVNFCLVKHSGDRQAVKISNGSTSTKLYGNIGSFCVVLFHNRALPLLQRLRWLTIVSTSKQKDRKKAKQTNKKTVTLF